jgi:hypothetical protein
MRRHVRNERRAQGRVEHRHSAGDTRHAPGHHQKTIRYASSAQGTAGRTEVLPLVRGPSKGLNHKYIEHTQVIGVHFVNAFSPLYRRRNPSF